VAETKMLLGRPVLPSPPPFRPLPLPFLPFSSPPLLPLGVEPPKIQVWSLWECCERLRPQRVWGTAPEEIEIGALCL